MTSIVNDKIARRNVGVLILAQGILGAQMPAIFTIGGLAGTMMAPNPCLATLPISCIVLGSMLSARPLSNYMQRAGRAAGFVMGAMGGFFGAMLCAYALYIDSFTLFLVGSVLTGMYMSAQGFFRFAALERASEDFKPKAVSYVMAGGLIAAILGPQIVKWTNDAFVVTFLGTYLAVMALNFFGSVVFFFLDVPKPQVDPHASTVKRSIGEVLREKPVLIVAMICALVSYALMNLVMTSTPLAVVGCGFTKNDAANVVSAHVLAMYIPSFFTGHVIRRIGAVSVIALGLVTLLCAGIVALMGVELENFYISLILLGVGWNFGFIGSTTLLAKNHSAQEQGLVQGVNDFVVFGGVTLASLASGGLMNCSGGAPQDGWSMVNLAMVPFLMLAAAALLYLARLRLKDARP